LRGLETRKAAAGWQNETVAHFEDALALFEKRDWENA